jgi:hypothetical protein
MNRPRVDDPLAWGVLLGLLGSVVMAVVLGIVASNALSGLFLALIGRG